MEETTSPGGSATPTPAPPVTGTPAPGSATPQKPQLTLEEALKRIADLEHEKGNATEEVERHRKKLTAYEKAEQQRLAEKKAAEEAQLSEQERITKQYAEIQAQHEATLRELQETKIQHAVLRDATELKFLHPEFAAKLLDWSELEYDSGTGIPTNTRRLLEKLLKAAPELAFSQQQAPTNPEQADSSASTAQKQQTSQPGLRPVPFAPAVPAMNPGRSTIPAPGVLPPGQIPRLSDVWRKK